MGCMQVLIFVSVFIYVNAIVYDRYSGKKVDEALIKELRSTNATAQCSIYVKPCTPHEGRRVNGTCNNYKHPVRGAARGPYLRLLKPDYANNKDIRKNKNRTDLPSARKVRTTLQTTGRVNDKKTFNVAAAHMLEFINLDVSVLNGPLDYLRTRPYCCETEGAADPRCIPILVPNDDPYLKVTDIRCLNFSRAETFQDAGCTPEIIQPEQINYQTPTIDLSTIYGVTDNASASIRDDHGLLKMEFRNNSYLPLANASRDICFQNQVNDNTCYGFGYPEVGNYDLRTTTLTIFFMREHNRLAKLLWKINPCWKDDRLFKVAREINIATAANIFMYELLPELLGYDNMETYGLITEQHVTSYDDDAVPLVYAEYEIAMRYFHTIFDGRVKKYHENYHYEGEYSISETLFRPGLIEQNKTFVEINRGTFYQSAGLIDDIQDPEISERFYAELQRAHDLPAIDIQRGRDMGIRGYNDYRQLCGLEAGKKFDDFLDVMEIEKVEMLKKLYDDIDDVDLLAGIMSENNIRHTFVGPTLFCIMTKQLHLFKYADRFWFERGDQFHSFTIPQLYEIKKTSMARFACDNAEGIKYIQPQAFLNVGHGNTPIPCTHIRGMDLTHWRDKSCSAHKYNHEHSHIHTDENNRKPQSHSEFVRFFGNVFELKPNTVKNKA